MVNNIKYPMAFLFLLVSSASMAIDRWGEFNKTYHYDRLKIYQNNNDTCTIEGIIINKTSELKDGVRIKIYAYDIHNTLQWSHVLRFSTIAAKGELDFSKKIKNCSNINPYKLSFKVRG